jgi:hypothetical protein
VFLSKSQSPSSFIIIYHIVMTSVSNPLNSIPTTNPLRAPQYSALLLNSSSSPSSSSPLLSTKEIVFPSLSLESNAEMGIINEFPPTLNGLGVGAGVTVGAALAVGDGVGDSVGELDGMDVMDGD